MQFFEGTVVGVKTRNTVAVEFAYFQKHPKYLKIIKKTTKLLVHCDLDNIKEGDMVKIVKSKPYSKNKHFKVVEKIK